MESDDRLLERLFKIHKTVTQMCSDRNYLVGQEELNMTLDEFKAKLSPEADRAKLTMSFQHKSDPSNQIMVFFPPDAKVGVGPIREMIEAMSKSSTSRGIIVVQEGLTPFARSTLSEAAPRFILEEFKEAELLVNITKHSLVPLHQLLSNEEKDELLKKYKLKEAQLPRIHSSDPVARYYGLKRGQVVKITRPSETAGRYVTYRLVL